MSTSNMPRRGAPYTAPPPTRREPQDFRSRARQLMDEPMPRWMRQVMSPALAQVVDWHPAVDVAESADEFTVTVELAGMKSKDVSVDFADGILTIRGEKASERETKDEKRKFHVWERSYGSFQRSFEFPMGVDADRIKAEFRDGVLHVRVPKRAEQAPNGRRIVVKDG